MPALPSHAMPAPPRPAEPSLAAPSQAVPCLPCRAKPSRATPRHALPCRAEPSLLSRGNSCAGLHAIDQLGDSDAAQLGNGDQLADTEIDGPVEPLGHVLPGDAEFVCHIPLFDAAAGEFGPHVRYDSCLLHVYYRYTLSERSASTGVLFCACLVFDTQLPMSRCACILLVMATIHDFGGRESLQTAVARRLRGLLQRGRGNG